MRRVADSRLEVEDARLSTRLDMRSHVENGTRDEVSRLRLPCLLFKDTVVCVRHVEGTCRSEEKREVLRIRGFTAHRFNPDDDDQLRCA